MALVSGGGYSLPDAGTILEQYTLDMTCGDNRTAKLMNALRSSSCQGYTYEPYGSVVAAESFYPHAVNRVGFQGLFFERYDGDYTLPCIAPGVRGLYYARNRFYDPILGRFIQRDPNETALPIITALVMNGEAVDILMGGFNAQGLYGDGMNLYAFARSNPLNSRDPLGLDFQDDIDDAITGYYAEGAAFAQQLGRKITKAGVNMLWATNVALLTMLFPPLGVALGAYGAANAILDIRDDGLNFDNAFDLASNLLLAGTSAPGAFAQIERGMDFAASRFGQFRAQQGRLETGYRGGPREYSLTDMIIQDTCFVAGTPVLLASGESVLIEDVAPGQTVASWPDPFVKGNVDAAPVQPGSWQEVHLRIDRADGGTTEAYLLRPIEWLERFGATTGNTIMIDLPEMELHGPACVVETGPCPETIETTDLRTGVVTGRFVTTDAAVLGLYLEDGNPVIRTTAAHPFWSLDRSRWVRAGDLAAGERLGTLDGCAVILATIPEPSRSTVYNLEIRATHTYFVSDAKVWVHNAYNIPKLAEELGYKRTKQFSFNSHGQAVYQKGTRFITPDIDSHRGGVWKMFSSKGDRLGTYNANLTRRVGD